MARNSARIYRAENLDPDSIPPNFGEQLLEAVVGENILNRSYVLLMRGSSHDGFMSDMISVCIFDDIHTKADIDSAHRTHLLCKLPPKNKGQIDGFCSSQMFDREVFVYAQVLPKFNHMQVEMGLDMSNGFSGFTKCHKVPNGIIVMDDLRIHRFQMMNKRLMAPFKNIKLLMEQLGRFHALSFVMRDQQPAEFRELSSNLTDIFVPILQRGRFQPMSSTGFQRVAEYMKRTPFEATIDRVKERWLNMYKAAGDQERLGRFAVIAHGDCWCNNMMFKLKEGVAQNVIMFDWQLSGMRSPVADIVNFLAGSTDALGRAKHLTTYLNIYYKNLSDTMRQFGTDPEEMFTRADLDDELRRNAFFGILNALIFLPVKICERECGKDERNPDVVLDEDAWRRLKVRLSELLVDAERYGWLEEMMKL